MNYRLELLSHDEFENLVNTICQNVLGTGVIAFSKGKDGGCDGRFTGTANNFPSNSANWKGKFVIQAKHTTNPIASCSDYDFKTQISKEIVKIKKLSDDKEVDYYIVFTNRKYTGITGEELRKKILNETGVRDVRIIGLETICNQYLNSNKQIVRHYNLDNYLVPFDFSEEEIRDLILGFRTQLHEIKPALETKVAEIKYDYQKISIEDKNRKNALGLEYFNQEIVGKSLEYFDNIDNFWKIR